ncbi:hypothetical protein HQ531_07305 [bacterium]|nr:hypothetical protein [bacterium]
MKKNKIVGLVTSIVDGNTFEISVHENNSDGSNAEKRLEKIRIQGFDKPAASTLSGILAKLELEKMIVGRTLECEIVGRDDSNQIIAIVPNRYFISPFSVKIDKDP